MEICLYTWLAIDKIVYHHLDKNLRYVWEINIKAIGWIPQYISFVFSGYYNFVLLFAYSYGKIQFPQILF